jgi:hypothetical protein
MLRHPRLRSFLATLLAICLVSVSLWSYGAEATADALSDEIAHFFPTPGDLPDPGFANQHCNQGCHAQSHLTGTECAHAPLFPMLFVTQEHLSWPGRTKVPSDPGDSPFRPPRTAFQA